MRIPQFETDPGPGFAMVDRTKSLWWHPPFFRRLSYPWYASMVRGCMVNPDGQFASFQRREVPDICARLQWVDLICTMLNLEDHESRMHFGRASVTRDVFRRRYRRSDDGRVNTLELQTSMVTHHKLLKGLSLWYVATISGRAQPEDCSTHWLQDL